MLDWLASELRDSGWNVQHIQKLIVTSATYRQDSSWNAEFAERDPDNRWFWRGPRHRLTGEQLRDQALAVSGLLSSKIGGPSVYPYQPGGLWEELAGGANDGPYKTSKGEDLYRRGLYTYRKRTVSHPTLATFDAPSWEVCYAQRATTNTPLQSLALLNDPTYVEAARHLAARILTDRSDSETTTKPDEKAFDSWESEAGRLVLEKLVDALFQQTLFRSPLPLESQRLVDSCQNWRRHYEQNPADATALLKVGETKVSPDLDSATLAALTIAASTLMNTDEFVTKE